MVGDRMGDQWWWWGALGAVMVVMFVIKPLVPANALGVTIRS